MKTLTGVRGNPICSAHRSRDGKLHGHTWQVIAWWDGKPDATKMKQMLDRHIRDYDHAELADDVSWGEGLAESVLRVLECERVQVSREAEGIYAVAER